MNKELKLQYKRGTSATLKNEEEIKDMNRKKVFLRIFKHVKVNGSNFYNHLTPIFFIKGLKDA